MSASQHLVNTVRGKKQRAAQTGSGASDEPSGTRLWAEPPLIKQTLDELPTVELTPPWSSVLEQSRTTASWIRLGFKGL